MKKSYILVLVILLALLLTGLWVLKSSHRLTESMPSEEKIEFVEQEATQSEEVTDETDSAEKAEVKDFVQSETNVNKTNEEINNNQERATEIKEDATTAAKTTVKKTIIKRTARKSPVSDEEAELLQKTPPAKEIVVDKEIKVRKVGKYIFK